MKLIQKDQYTIMPWKNGQGSTAQIDIVPEGASFPAGDFFWRVSSATVAVSSSFSQFPGCDRWLVVLSGNGLQLNGNKLAPLAPIQFSGEDVIQCDLIGGPVVDLGVIYSRERAHAAMTVQIQTPQAEINLTGHTYLYCVEGSLRCNDLEIGPGDTLIVEEGQTISVVAEESSLSILIQMNRKN